VLVNNAAIFASVGFTHGPHDQISVDEWDRMFAVNVRGVWLCCREVIPHMRERGYGKIINIASGTAYKGIPHMLHYTTAKAAIGGLTRVLSRELGVKNIRVNAIVPGAIGASGFEVKVNFPSLFVPTSYGVGWTESWR